MTRPKPTRCRWCVREARWVHHYVADPPQYSCDVHGPCEGCDVYVQGDQT